MKMHLAVIFLVFVCLFVYWPHKNAQFVLDDYYTVVRNPLIKNPSLYQNIWTSRLFDANQSSSYIRFGYYRPVLQCSWIMDYSLFHLNARGYQWFNLFIHFLNCLCVYILFYFLFEQNTLALKAAVLFSVIPTQEWVVRYVTGRGDELSALFALLSLISFCWVLKNKNEKGYILFLVFLLLAALTREVAILYVLYALIIRDQFYGEKNVIKFSLYWITIGIFPLLLLISIIPKQGNILALHLLYFASAGICLWMAQLRFKWVIALFLFFASISLYQGHFWTTEQALLRHTKKLECWPHTVVDQQLLMKYDDDIPEINSMIEYSQSPVIKAIWLRRLGIVYFEHKDLMSAQKYFSQSLSLNPRDPDTLNALAVVFHYKGNEIESLKLLNQALEINPFYPDTLRTLGIYYYLHKDFPKARDFLSACLLSDPDNPQAQDLLRLAKAAN